EITQFTYFQQIGSIELDPVSLELTYGLERIAMFIQKADSIFDLEWTDGLTYGDVHLEDERQFSRYNFEEADVDMHLELFNVYEAEAERLLDAEMVLPAYDWVLKCSHTFNMLDARGAIGVAERTAYIGRVRKLARRVAQGYIGLRESLGFPLLRHRRQA
ncbi:MAG: glycine--tRNA ligase subunit alpha, partial [Planctomycetes bacterium]|nr:glycine--tRNA ligase subunit alpha [Planctomycetota bacterium]